MRLAFIALVACGGATPPPEMPEAPIDQSKAAKDARAHVGEVYRTLEKANTDGLQTLSAETLIAFGPRKGDALATRTDAIVALRSILDPKAKRFNLHSGGLVVNASNGGHSAWAVDVLIAGNDRVAVSAVMTSADDLWLVDTVAIAKTPGGGAIRASQKSDAIVPPSMAAPPKTVDGATGAHERFAAETADARVVAADFADNGIAIGAGGEMVKGKAQLAAAWKRKIRSHVRYAGAGEASTGITKDQQVAWVTAPVVRFADKEEPLPMRLFAIYTRTGNAWKLAVQHETIAIDEAGAGAGYRKIPAPPIVEEPKPVAPAKKPPPKKK